MNEGKCPNCGDVINSVYSEPIEIHSVGESREKGRGVAFVCPNSNCRHIFSVQMSSEQMVRNIVSQIKTIFDK